MAVQIISLPATHLSARARSFRTEFVSKHLQPQVNYPFFQALFSLGLLPTPSSSINTLGGYSATRLLGGRDHLAINGTMLSNAGMDFDCPFTFEIFGRSDNILVNIPKSIRIRATFDPTKLELRFLSTLSLTFLNKPVWGEIREPPLPFNVSLVKLLFTDSVIDFELTDQPASGEVWVVRLTLS